MSDTTDELQYYSQNFLNFIKQKNNKGNLKNETVNKQPDSAKKSRIKGWNKKDLEYIECLKKEEMADNEKYDEKFKRFLLKNKKEKKVSHRKRKYKHSEKEEKKCMKKKRKKRNTSSSSSDDSTSDSKECSSNSSDNDNSFEKTKTKNKIRKEKHKKYKEQTKKKKGDNSGSDSVKENIYSSRNYTKIKNANNNKNIHRKDINEEWKKDHNESDNSRFDENAKKKSITTPDNEALKTKIEQMIEEKKSEMLLRNALNKNLVDCKYCIDSNNFNKINKLNVISISKRSYICYYNYKNIFLKHQLFISPIEHTTSITNTNFETINDIRNHMKSLIRMFEESNQTCIFIEFNNCFNRSIELISMRKTKHTYINCYVIPLELLSKAKSYFKKNLSDINSLYRENKELIITDKKYAPLNIIPKNMPYISVNFALVETYIQIIENNYDYINMCKCIFTDLYKKDKLYKYFKSFDHFVNTVENFKTSYKKYDWTNYMNN